ncbi:MAG: uracil-DNA glycosylase, partial [Psychromonas sp.]
TDAVIDKLNKDKESLVFMLWGNYAHKKGKFIDTEKHLVLKAKHPSPLSANFGGWFGQQHFSKSNNYLVQKGWVPIKW